jgi:hypothetical protein
MLSEKHRCPVCAYPDLSEAPYDEHGCATHTICPCCGTEFGYDDAGNSHQTLRERWIANGMKWWSKRQAPPQAWDPVEQLNRAGFLKDEGMARSK